MLVVCLFFPELLTTVYVHLPCECLSALCFGHMVCFVCLPFVHLSDGHYNTYDLEVVVRIVLFFEFKCAVGGGKTPFGG